MNGNNAYFVYSVVLVLEPFWLFLFLFPALNGQKNRVWMIFFFLNYCVFYWFDADRDWICYGKNVKSGDCKRGTTRNFGNYFDNKNAAGIMIRDSRQEIIYVSSAIVFNMRTMWAGNNSVCEKNKISYWNIPIWKIVDVVFFIEGRRTYCIIIHHHHHFSSFFCNFPLFSILDVSAQQKVGEAISLYAF